MDFRKIKFGNADAREEGAFEPALLTEGYFNLNQVVEEVKSPSKFLFLGPKGSGKSALSEHLRLTSSKHHTFVNTILLKDFPYKSFKKIIEGPEEIETKLPKAWNWILLIYIIDSLRSDNGLKKDPFNNWDKTVSKLKSVGISPSEDINDLVNKSAKRNFKIGLTEMFNLEYSSESIQMDSETKFYHLVKHLRDLISQVKSKNSHFLIIDGLDEVFSSGDKTMEAQYASLAALINEAKSLNLFFRNSDLKIKIIVLCRTDLFERLPDPNKNKIRRDSSFLLHWQPESIESGQSPLVKLVNLRGSLCFNNEVDVFGEFFPESLEGHTMENYLLQYTRHTPRDFLQLLKIIQEFTRSNNVEINNILTGVNDYSVRYFLPEIRDEMVGYLTMKQIDLAIEALSMVRSRYFSFTQLNEKIEEIDNQGYLSCKELVFILYECGALGQVYEDKSKKKRYNFKFRNPHSNVRISDRFIFHRGLWKSFNIN